MKFCLCGCLLEISEHSIFKKGHNLRVNNPMKNRDIARRNGNTKILFHGHVPFEERICSCGCMKKFTCKVTSGRKYCVSGHANKNKTYYEIYGNNAQRQKMQRAKSISDSTKGRTWNETYGVIRANKRRTMLSERISKLQTGKTYEERFGIEKARVIKDRISLNSGWKKYINNKNLLSKRISKILSKVCQRPNKFEFRCSKQLERQFPNKFKYVGNGSVIINGKSPDFVSEELKIVVLCNGIYWHLFRQGLTLSDKKIVELKEAKPFIDAGYEVWFIWELDEQNIDIVGSIV